MSWKMTSLGVLCLLLPLAACTSDNQQQTEEGPSTPAVLSTSQDSLSYAFGMNIGESIQHLQADMNVAILMRGIEDLLAKRQMAMTGEQAGQVIAVYSARRRTEGERERLEMAGKNAEAGRAFLTENAQRAGVTTTASGLQYEVLKEAEGPKPKTTDQVRVHYQGTLVDGTIFDSSIERGEPVTFELGRVIDGWIEGLQLMSVGSKYKFYIPGELGYGETGGPPGSQIGPNAVLTFEVELLGIVG